MWSFFLLPFIFSFWALISPFSARFPSRRHFMKKEDYYRLLQQSACSGGLSNTFSAEMYTHYYSLCRCPKWGNTFFSKYNLDTQQGRYTILAYIKVEFIRTVPISSLGLIYLNEKRLNIQELCMERRESTTVEREQYAQFDSSIL